MLEKDGDLISIHTTTFGKWIGSIFSVIFTLYCLLFCLTVLRTYMEVIQVWIFPTIKLWKLTLMFLLVTYYIIKGGFRSVTGICFWGVILPIFVVFFLIYPMKYAHFRNILPIFTHSPTDMLISAKQSALEFLGFETILIFYPFIEKGKSLKRWAHAGIAFSTLIYVILAIVSFMYYSEGQLNRTIWPTLTMLKLLRFLLFNALNTLLFLFGFNYFAKPLLNYLVIMSNDEAFLSYFVYIYITVFIFIIFSISLLFTNRESINTLNTVLSQAGLYIVYAYIPILFLFHSVRWRFKNQSKNLQPIHRNL